MTPDGGTDPGRNRSSSYSTTFTVKNTGTFQYTFTLTCGRSGQVLTCDNDLEQITLGAGVAGNVPVYYTTGVPGTGTVSLKATRSGGVSDSGWVNVTVLNEGGAALILKNHHREVQDRSLCLTTGGAGETAAVGCGHLLVTHSTPGYATLGRTRALTLLYNSQQASPGAVLPVTVIQRANVAQPSSVFLRLRLTSDTTVGDSATFTAWGGAATNQPRQAVLWFVQDTLKSGIYPVTLLVRNSYPGITKDSTFLDTLIVVNRVKDNRFGAGWSLVGVERLHFNQPAGTSHLLWVGGDGSARWYRQKVGDNTRWIAPAGAYRDTILFAGGVYTRTLRHGVQVVFDGAGRHIRTVARTGQATSFTWGTTAADSFSLLTVRVPPGGVSGTTYTLAYDGSQKLDRITDPAGRVLDVTVTANRLRSIVDPDTTVATQFAYDSTGPITTLLKTRRSRRGFTTVFFYQGPLLTQASVPHDTAAASYAITGYAPWNGKGWVAHPHSTPQTAVDTSTVFTLITGPRAGVADDAKVWVDKWGAPVTIVGAISDTTRVYRGSTLAPALVTRVVAPDQRTDSLVYDALGNLTTHRLTFLGDATPRITRWTYRDTLNTRFSPDSVIDESTGQVSRFRYNAWGLDTLAVAPNGHITRFLYRPPGPDSLQGLLQSVRDSLVPVYAPASDSSRTTQTTVRRFGFNVLGNVVADTSPLGRVDSLVRDATQRAVRRRDAGGHWTDLSYDALNRVRSARTGAGADTATTTYTWLLDVLTQVTDPRGVYRKYLYDPLGRVIRETDDYNLSETRAYDFAGNLTSRVLRTGHTVIWQYDAANRDTLLGWPARDTTGGSIPGDTVRYSYDTVGRLLQAATRHTDTLVRTYYPSGLLQTEVSKGPARRVSLGFGYDLGGRRTALRIGTPGVSAERDSVWYAYDATSGDLASLTVLWRGTTAQASVLFGWDALGRRDKLTYSNGAVVRFTYDADGQLRLLCGTGPDPSGPGTGQFDVRHHVDSVSAEGLTIRVNRVTAKGCPVGTGWPFAIDSLAYDSRHRIASRKASANELWQFDRSGNRTLHFSSATVPTDTTQDEMQASHNRLLFSRKLIGGGYRTYLYDLNGALRRDIPCVPVPSGCDSTAAYNRKYYYDGLGRSVGRMEKVPGGGTGAFCFYDAIGRPLTTCEQPQHQLGYDGPNIVRTGSDNQPTPWTFIHGPGVDDPLLAHRPSGNYTYFFVTDGQGRQVAVGKANGDAADMTIGGAKASGSVPGGTTFDPKRLESPAMPTISFFRNRWYDAETGRWTQEDPLGVAGGVNLYQYVSGNPVALTDPFGLCPEHMRGLDTKSMAECQEWNQRRVTEARRVIERNSGKDGVDQIPEGQRVWGVNDSDVEWACEGAEEVTNRGCINKNGTIVVNADRDPENIGATIQHELVHLPGSRAQRKDWRSPFGENCALKREVNAGRVFNARPDKAFTFTFVADPTINCRR